MDRRKEWGEAGYSNIIEDAILGISFVSFPHLSCYFFYVFYLIRDGLLYAVVAFGWHVQYGVRRGGTKLSAKTDPSTLAHTRKHSVKALRGRST